MSTENEKAVREMQLNWAGLDEWATPSDEEIECRQEAVERLLGTENPMQSFVNDHSIKGPLQEEKDFAPTALAYRDDTGRLRNAVWDQTDVRLHSCHACNGTGVWMLPLYARRGKSGPCHKCQGRGHFKTSGAERTKAREYRKLTSSRKLESGKDRILADHTLLVIWLKDNANWNDFARSLIEQFNTRGMLSDKQLTAAERMMAKCLAKDEEKKRDREWQVKDSVGLDLTDLPAGRYAIPDGDTRLKVLVNKPTGRSVRWGGHIFVSDAAEYGARTNYGRQKPGGKYVGKIEQELTVIMEDPRAASIAYGKLVGHCGVCGRKLEDEQSVAAGIGPVCASKFEGV